MQITKSKLQQIIQEEFKHMKEEEKMPTDWDMVEELDQLISRLQRIREVLHVKSGVFEGKTHTINEDELEEGGRPVDPKTGKGVVYPGEKPGEGTGKETGKPGPGDVPWKPGDPMPV